MISFEKVDANTKHRVKDCPPSAFAKKCGIFFDLVYGLESEIPLCCAIEYQIREWAGQQPAVVCSQEGVWYSSDFVPCWYHRRQWKEPKPEWMSDNLQRAKRELNKSRRIIRYAKTLIHNSNYFFGYRSADRTNRKRTGTEAGTCRDAESDTQFYP